MWPADGSERRYVTMIDDDMKERVCVQFWNEMGVQAGSLCMYCNINFFICRKKIQ